ncbi:hypothetical protein [Cyclobacterium jeungdonense]|nr:hypothetical protein [Cyclobacterium jeungdonense]
MICGIKVKLDSRVISQLLQNSALEFQSILNCSTGEVDTKKFLDEEGIFISVKNAGYGYIKGSLHKYKNKGHHNHDDFSWPEVSETNQRLSDRLMVDVRKLPLINLEWGLNIPMDADPNMLLSGLVRHNGSPFKNMYVFPGKHYVANHRDYEVKIYNKSAQYRLSSHLLRYELSSKKARFFNRLGIGCLGDLEKNDNQSQLFHSLLSEWDNILLIDPLIYTNAENSRKDEIRLANWKNPSFWNKSNRRVRSYQLEQYEKYLLQHHMRTKEKFGELLRRKFIQL